MISLQPTTAITQQVFGGNKNDYDNQSFTPDHIFQTVKAGVLVPVQTLFENFGTTIFSLKDDKGHTPVHWACLGGHTTILRFMIESKANVDTSSENELAAHPIHWACVNGHIAIVDILLQTGVSIDVCDRKGCTPLIVASQYGQTMLAGYLMGKGARIQMVDKDGDNALHWAAFKGQSELMRLLIYSGFNPLQQDNYGQTALHLACISGNLTAVRELCEQDNADINLTDKNGKTPLMLATGRKYTNVIDYLRKELKLKNSILPRIDFWSIVFGPPGNSKGAILFFVFNLLCWAYPMYIFKCIPATYDYIYLHVVFFMSNAMMWICLYHANTTDPGYLPRNVEEYDLAIKQVAQYDEWKQGQSPLARLCHTCRTVKPIRSKHCRVCNRCVLNFDHHCPYIYNCVGYSNRGWFYGFLLTVALNCVFTVIFSILLLSLLGWDWAVILGLLEMAFFCVIAVGLSLFATYNASVNLTTNEMLNYKRYKYLQDTKGNFYNPYNRGVRTNLEEFFQLRQPPGEDDVSFLRIV